MRTRYPPHKTGPFGKVPSIRRTAAPRERGATIVEFAIVMPLLVLLMVGIMETGIAFYDYLTIERATLEGVRTAAFTGRSPDADCETVLSIVDSLPSGFLDRIQRIEIYRADTEGNQILGETNIWTYLGGDPADCATGWSNPINPWPPSARYTAAGPSRQLDIIGVRIRMPRSWITNLPPFSGNYVIDETSILRIEPEVFE